MKYLSIDLETLGLNPKHCDVIEVAMVLEDTSKPDVLVKALPYFHSLIRHDVISGEIYALKMNWELLQEAQEKGTPPPYVVWNHAHRWLINQLPQLTDQEKITVAGKNVANFDLRFMPPVVTKYFHHRCIDPASMFVDWNEKHLPSLEQLKKGIVAHTALEDARDVIEVLRSTYNR